MSDDDSQQQAVKSNESQRRTVTVCPQCKAACRSDVMRCHGTVRRLDIEWSMRLIPTHKVSTGNAETMSAMARLRDNQDFVREGTVK